jgi:hypothetical protein
MPDRPLPGFEIQSWREWCADRFQQLREAGMELSTPALADPVSRIMPLDTARQMVRETVGRYANEWLNKNVGRGVPSTPRRLRKSWEQMELDELISLIAERHAQRKALEASAVRDIEAWLIAHPDVQLSVSEILVRAGYG